MRGGRRLTRSLRKLLPMILTASVIFSLIFVGAGCSQTSPALRIEIDYLEAGEPAPFPGYLLSPRLLIHLYVDAETQTTEEILEHLRQER